MKPYIVNIGLPRTGTTSFAFAIRMLGKKCLDIWSSAENNPKVLQSFQSGGEKERLFLANYDALCDTPFYLQRKIFEAFYPKTTVLCTKRPKDDWVRSMLNHRLAGGRFFANHFGIENFPYTADSIPALEHAYNYHYKIVCKGIPTIDISETKDYEKWEKLCSAFPNRDALLSRVCKLPWPVENVFETRCKY